MTQGNHTTASWNQLQNMLNAGRTVNNNAQATQTQVDTAYTNLRNALNALQLNPPDPPPEPPPQPPPLPPTRPPPTGPPANIQEGLLTGDLSGFRDMFVTLAFNHLISPIRIMIGIFAIIVSGKMIVRLFQIIFSV